MKQISMAIAVAAAVVIGAAVPALADEATPDSEGGRYVFSKQANGFLRLDSRSGAVSLCTEQPVGWACLTAPEDRAVFETEIARLQSENAAKSCLRTACRCRRVWRRMVPPHRMTRRCVCRATPISIEPSLLSVTSGSVLSMPSPAPKSRSSTKAERS
jgi:hypothetical protein